MANSFERTAYTNAPSILPRGNAIIRHRQTTPAVFRTAVFQPLRREGDAAIMRVPERPRGLCEEWAKKPRRTRERYGGGGAKKRPRDRREKKPRPLRVV